MSRILTPVEIAAAVFGGVGRIGPAIGLNRTRASHWKRGGPQSVAGDFPSVRVVREIRAAAALRGIDLPLDWLVYGAPEVELRALLDTPPARVAAE